MASAPGLDMRLLTFTVGDRSMALPASVVREIIPMPRMARVPHAPAALLGVANLRGTVIPVVSVLRLLGDEEARSHRVIVVDADGPIGLAVSDVSHLVTQDDASAVEHLDMAALIARAVPEYRARRASGRIALRSAESTTAEASEAVPLVAFSVSGQDFALPLSAIDEVLRLPADIALMPHADTAVVGSMNQRGTLLPLLSLAALLSLPVLPATRRSRIIVVQIGTHRVGFVVDAMQAVVRVPETDIDPVPHVLNRGGAEARIQAICRMGNGARLLSVLAPAHLLHDDITARMVQGDLGEQSDMMAAGATQGGERFLIFRIGEESFGLPIEAVEEVAPLPPRLTPLPKAPDFVQGVMNVRGKVIPVIDQSRRFNDTPTDSAKPRVIVARIGEVSAGFIVDAVTEVVLVPAHALRDAPDLGTAGSRVFDRVATLDGRDTLVLIVSPRELLDRAEQDLLAKLGRKGAAKAAS